MKKSIIYSLVVLCLIMSCRKNDNPILPAGLTQVPVPQITPDPTGNATISAQTPDAFSGKVIVGLYFPAGPAPAKFDIVVIKNGNTANIQTLATNITTFPTTITVTGPQLKSLFGNTTIVTGDAFTIGANVTTQGGAVYQAFPVTGVAGTTAYGTGVLSQPGISLTTTFAAVCTFNATAYGTFGASTPYKVLRDDWADYTVGQVIPVTVIDATHISFMYAANAAKPIIITVNPVNNTTTVASVVYGNYGAPYGNFSAVSVPSADDFVAPCALTVSVKLHHTDDKGNDFGNYTIQLQKQ